jgi:chromosome segregation ATPase
MPATEETYRKQPTLHIVFAVSSIAMTLSIVWMILADHLRPWKEVQREFHYIEDAKLRAQEKTNLEKLKSEKQAQLDEIDAQIKKAKETAYERASELREVDKTLKKLGGTVEKLDTEKRFTKAELDSQRSLYDGMVERGEERAAPRSSRPRKSSRLFHVSTRRPRKNSTRLRRSARSCSAASTNSRKSGRT